MFLLDYAFRESFCLEIREREKKIHSFLFTIGENVIFMVQKPLLQRKGPSPFICPSEMKI
jgi:hypothetical protein